MKNLPFETYSPNNIVVVLKVYMDLLTSCISHEPAKYDPFQNSKFDPICSHTPKTLRASEPLLRRIS